METEVLLQCVDGIQRLEWLTNRENAPMSGGRIFEKCQNGLIRWKPNEELVNLEESGLVKSQNSSSVGGSSLLQKPASHPC